jgi:VRR-NUC domain
MSEREIQNEIQLELSRGPTRLLRINAGQAWQGRVVEQTPDRLILSPWYPIKLGATGISDLIGWTSISGAIGSYACDVAIFTAVEVKGPRTPITPEQLAFIDTVRRAGGRAGVARSVEEAGRIISGGSE